MNRAITNFDTQGIIKGKPACGKQSAAVTAKKQHLNR